MTMIAAMNCFEVVLSSVANVTVSKHNNTAVLATDTAFGKVSLGSYRCTSIRHPSHPFVRPHTGHGVLRR
jgi:hypothetical protein